MKTVFQFLKPYRKLCVFTILAMLLDVAGGLLVPRLTADMINIGVKTGNMEYIIEKGIAMLAVTILAGAGALIGSWLCADLSAKLGRDMRNAVYEKSLTFSEHDFSRFGTGSMITRTLNDINIIQQSVVWCIQMVLPVPAVCVMGVAMAFAVDTMMGFLLIGVTVLIIVLALVVTRRASQIFGRLQQLLDRMNVVLRENLTGVRVIRAFRKEKDEEKRMRKSFEDYAETSISANLLFAGLESTAFFVINICIVAILWLGGDRIGAAADCVPGGTPDHGTAAGEYHRAPDSHCRSDRKRHRAAVGDGGFDQSHHAPAGDRAGSRIDGQILELVRSCLPRDPADRRGFAERPVSSAGSRPGGRNAGDSAHTDAETPWRSPDCDRPDSGGKLCGQPDL